MGGRNTRRAGGDRRARAVRAGGGVTIARPAAVFQRARREHERRRHARRHGRVRGRREAEACPPAAAASVRAPAAAAARRPLLRAPQVARPQARRRPHALRAQQRYPHALAPDAACTGCRPFAPRFASAMSMSRSHLRSSHCGSLTCHFTISVSLHFFRSCHETVLEVRHSKR